MAAFSDRAAFSANTTDNAAQIGALTREEA